MCCCSTAYICMKKMKSISKRILHTSMYILYMLACCYDERERRRRRVNCAAPLCSAYISIQTRRRARKFIYVVMCVYNMIPRALRNIIYPAHMQLYSSRILFSQLSALLIFLLACLDIHIAILPLGCCINHERAPLSAGIDRLAAG